MEVREQTHSRGIVKFLICSVLVIAAFVFCFLYWAAISWTNQTFRSGSVTLQELPWIFKKYELPFEPEWIEMAGSHGWLDSSTHYYKVKTGDGFDFQSFVDRLIERGAVHIPMSFEQYEEDFDEKLKEVENEEQFDLLWRVAPDSTVHRVAFYRMGIFKLPFRKTPFEEWWDPGSLSDLRVLYYGGLHHKLALSYSAKEGVVYIYCG